MKNRNKINCLIVILLTITIFIILIHKINEPSLHSSVTNELNKVKTPATLPTPHTVGTNELTLDLKRAQHVPTEKMKWDWENEVRMWQSPLLYYGKVIDENGQPIQGVKVSYGANAMNEARREIYNTGIVKSDERGFFKIDGVRGVGLFIQLSHTNYYLYPGNSTGFDKRSLPKKGYFSDSEENAEIFRMHRKGNPVPLIFRHGGFHAPNNGSMANFPLRGQATSDILGQLQIQGWNNLRSESYPYDWKVEISMPSGGMAESTNYFDFVAPETGYSNRSVIEVAGGEGASKTYFLKLPLGYVKFNLSLIMGKDMFVSGQYYYNPDGSRNLEPAQ